MRRRTNALITVVLTVLLAADAHGQEPRQPKQVCFRGRPAAACRAFWLTEGGYYRHLAGTGFVQTFPNAPDFSEDRVRLGGHLSWEVGGMVNRGERTALGGTVLLGADDRGMRFGVKGRYRRWIGAADGTFDLSAGVLKASAAAPYPLVSADAYGPTVDVSIGWADLIAATARADVLYTERGRAVNAVYGGVRLGSYPAVIGTAALATYAAIIVIAVLSAGDF